jgi:hypothetical protein
MSNTFKVKVFYELIVEDDFEFETEGEIPIGDIVGCLLAHERLRNLRVTDATGKTYELGPARMLIKDFELYSDVVCTCGRDEGDTE